MMWMDGGTNKWSASTRRRYDDGANEADRTMREALLGPYNAQADEEGRADQKARRKRKAAESTEAELRVAG